MDLCSLVIVTLVLQILNVGATSDWQQIITPDQVIRHNLQVPLQIEYKNPKLLLGSVEMFSDNKLVGEISINKRTLFSSPGCKLVKRPENKMSFKQLRQCLQVNGGEISVVRKKAREFNFTVKCAKGKHKSIFSPITMKCKKKRWVGVKNIDHVRLKRLKNSLVKIQGTVHSSSNIGLRKGSVTEHLIVFTAKNHTTTPLTISLITMDNEFICTSHYPHGISSPLQSSMFTRSCQCIAGPAFTLNCNTELRQQSMDLFHNYKAGYTTSLTAHLSYTSRTLTYKSRTTTSSCKPLDLSCDQYLNLTDRCNMNKCDLSELRCSSNVAFLFCTCPDKPKRTNSRHSKRNLDGLEYIKRIINDPVMLADEILAQVNLWVVKAKGDVIKYDYVVVGKMGKIMVEGKIINALKDNGNKNIFYQHSDSYGIERC